MNGTAAQTGKSERVKVTVPKDSMSVSILFRQPQAEDQNMTVDEIKTVLSDQGITFGVDEAVIEKAVEENAFNTPIRVAVGVHPKRGASSSFTYHFDTSEKHVPEEGEDGRIDYREINFIRNTEKGAILVTKTPAQPGEPGKNVFGKEIAGPPGRDLPIKNGVNTEITENGLELRATAGGAIVFQHGKISVMDIFTIKGDVDFKVGNLDCRGSVRVTGDIKAGFELKIDGDLEVGGNVEDAIIHVKGNILVKGGFFGNNQGVMHADGDIMLKYAEGQKISAGGNIIVGGEIINCQVTSGDSVHVKSRRGKIIGGQVRAGKEIRTSVAGSEAGTPTGLYVAYNAEAMAKYLLVRKELTRLHEDNKRISEALYGLYRLQIDGKLPASKEEAFKKLQVFKRDLPVNLQTLEKQKADIEAEMAELKDACIIVDATLHHGVKTYFGIIYREILENQQRCKITLEDSQVVISDLKKQ